MNKKILVDNFHSIIRWLILMIRNVVMKIINLTDQYIKFLLFFVITIWLIGYIIQQQKFKFISATDENNGISYYCFDRTCFTSVELGDNEYDHIKNLYDLHNKKISEALITSLSKNKNSKKSDVDSVINLKR